MLMVDQNASNSIKVLLVGGYRKDAQAIRDSLTEARWADFQVEHRQRLSDGLEHLKDNGIDVVLIDAPIPDGDQDNVLAKLSATNPDMPAVIFVSSEDEEADKALAQGAQDYILKSQRSGDLLAHCLAHAVQRSSAEGKSRHSDRSFRSLMENSPDGIALLDAQGRGIYNSPSFKHLLGYAQTDNIGSSSLDFIYPDDVPKAIENFSKITKAPGAAVTVQARAKHKDGSWRHVEAVATNRLDDPAVQAIVINLRDITERLQTEEAFRRRARFYRRLIEHVMDGLFVVSPEAKLLYQSPAMERLSGISVDKTTGMIGWDFVHPDDFKWANDAFGKFASSDPGATTTTDLRIRHGDGEWIWINAVGTNCLKDPVLKGIIMVVRDVTDRKAMEDALKRSEQELKEATDKLKGAIEEVCTPVVQVWDNILALPLMGMVDDRRAQQVMETLLQRIVETQSELVILDVTGVPSMDTMVVNMLIRTIRSTSMLGAKCVLTGMKPELAQAVIHLDLDISRLTVRRDLEEGLKWALTSMGEEGTGDGPVIAV